MSKEYRDYHNSNEERTLFDIFEDKHEYTYIVACKECATDGHAISRTISRASFNSDRDFECAGCRNIMKKLKIIKQDNTFKMKKNNE